MKGWLDNFGKADNANDSEVNLPEGFVGLAYDTKGRNYSPAWGGQFKQGGVIPIAQNGVSEYMEKKKWEEKDKNIAKTYDLPEVVVSAPIMTKYNDPDKLTGYPQYIPKSGDNTDIPGWDMAEFYKSWVSSPEYERRMKNTGYYENVPGGAIYRKEGSTIYPQMGEWLSNARESRMGALESVQEPGFIQIEPVYYKGLPASRYTGLGIDIHPDHTKTPEMFETVLAHEIGHAIDSTTPFEDSLITSTMLPFSEFNKSFYTIDPVTGSYQPINQKDDIRRSQALHIRNDPQEFKSDLNALRYLMFDKGVYDIRKGKEFTKEDLERAKEVLKGNQSLDRTIQAAGESGLIKLMNIIAKGKEDVTPVAMNGASMPGAVGFTYARVAGAAPSKGKYAKKTMASAQNGIIADKIAGLELKMSPEYQRLKYLQSLPQLRQAPGRGEELVREGLATADIATDLMQIGNFIPHPMAQGVGKAGNILGSGVDLAQALMSARQGNYLDAAINLGSVGLAGGLASSTFRRNSKYLQPGQPLYALSPQAFGSLSRTNYIEPFRKVGKMTDKNLLANRALLGLIGAETVYDAIPQKEYGGDIPSAQNGQEMKFYQNGLDWKPKSMQEGGIIKDNLGYWNPDNWGQPVEIGSNNITMEGVYEPLLGISDTGDTKLMQPGKNYKFKGKKVTEYPVAQYGKGVPFRSAQNPTKNTSNLLNLRKELVPYIKPKPSFEEQKRIAKLELDKYGYTSDQRKGYVKGKSEKAFKNIVPQGYGDLEQTLDRIERYEKNLGRNPNETLWYGAEDSPTGKPIYYDLPKRDDAFALYLGLPQKNKSFGISEYQPGDSKENKYYFKPNYLDENLKNRLIASYFDNVNDGENVYIANERLDAFRQKTDSLRREGVPDENPIYAKWIVDNPLGDFKMSKGKDEKGHYISIYDVWDLNPFKQGEGASSNAAAATLKAFAKMKGVDVDDETEMSNLFGAGKPFEIYDRIYYDPKTKKVIPQKRNGGGVGINQLDAQPMKKLNQLLNFTNNPDKDNWLDKYN